MKNFHRFECLRCKEFSTYSIIKFIKHIKKEHNSKLTFKDWRFAIRYYIVTQILFEIVKYPLAVLIILGSWITYPFWWLHEFFSSF
jgi:hypothetical protein